MVIGREFVWAHLGKTGGNSCHKMFELVNDGSLLIDSIDDPSKHRAFEHEPRAGERVRVMNFRRLGPWLISHNVHMAVREGLTNPEYYIAEGLAWWSTGAMTADEALCRHRIETVRHWIRMEYLGEDFIAVIGRFLRIDSAQQAAIRLVHENRGYDKLLARFDPAACRACYARNPIWAGLEKSLYATAN